MPEPILTSDRQVRFASPEQAKLLLSVEDQPMLLRLMFRSYSASELTQALERPFKHVHYRLQLLERAGIAQIVEVTPRNGRGIKRYAIPHAWYVAYRQTSSESVWEFLQNQVEPRLNAFLHHLQGNLETHADGIGFLFHVNEGQPVIHLQQEGQPPLTLSLPYIMSWGQLHLHPARAAKFLTRLNALFEEFGEEEGESYMIGTFLTKGTFE